MALNNHHVDIDRLVCSRTHFSKQRRQTWVPIREKFPGRFPRLARKVGNLRKRRDRIQTGIHWFSCCETPRFLVWNAVLAGPFCCLRHLAGHAGQVFFKLSLSIQGSSWLVFGCTPLSFGMVGGLDGTVNSLTPRAPEEIWAKTVTSSITRSPTGNRTLPFLATKASRGMDKVFPAGIPFGSLEKNCSFNSIDRFFQAESVAFLIVRQGTSLGDSSWSVGEIHIVSKRTSASSGGSGILPV